MTQVLSYIALGFTGLYVGISGFLKLREPLATTQATIEAYSLLRSRRNVRFLSATVPPMEVAIGALLVCGLAPLIAATAAALLLISYAVVMMSVLVRGMSTDCGCHGSLSRGEVRTALVVRNVVLVAIVIAAAAGVTLEGAVAPISVSLAATGVAILVVVALTVAQLFHATTRGTVEKEKAVV